MDETTIERGIKFRKKIIRAIIYYIEKHGYAPTVREIGDMVGLRSTSTVHSHLKELIRSGELESDVEYGAPRAIRVPGYKYINERSKGSKMDIYNNTAPLQIKIKYFGDVRRIEKISVGDWIDLRVAEDVEMKAGEYKRLPLGVAMELPKGYEALAASRSSTFEKYGIILVNGIGVIDESYCGDNDQWHYLAYAVRDTKIPKDERICQFRIIKHQPEVELVETEHLGNADRGGIGSTGRK